jgi:V-type H+-transporting ATPase subunit d
MFNAKDGFLEATVRGCMGGFLRAEDYSNLQQCETLEDIKLYLTNTDYGSLIQNEASPTHPSLIVRCCLKKIVHDFSFFESQAAEPLSTFLQYLKYGYMIDNIVLMVTGAMHEREVTELLDKCHPLGMFDSIASLGAVSNLRLVFCKFDGRTFYVHWYRELHRIVLVDTPISAYFGECFRDENLDEVNVEILRNSLYKAYLKDFFRLSQMLGGLTATVMKVILFPRELDI